MGKDQLQPFPWKLDVSALKYNRKLLTHLRSFLGKKQQKRPFFTEYENLNTNISNS